MPKFNEIGPNEAARMIIRGVLFGAPQSIRNKYRSAVAPLFLSDETDAPVEIESEEKINQRLDDFIKEISNYDLKISFLNNLDESERLNWIKEQVKNVLQVAHRYISDPDFKYYANFLITITKNVESRKIVPYQLADEETDSKVLNASLAFEYRIFRNPDSPVKQEQQRNIILKELRELSSEIKIEDDDDQLNNFLNLN